MGVSNAKARAGKAVLVIQHASAQVRRALGINENLRASVLDRDVASAWGASLHDILEASAAAFFDSQAQAIAGSLRGDQIQ